MNDYVLSGMHHMYWAAKPVLGPSAPQISVSVTNQERLQKFLA